MSVAHLQLIAILAARLICQAEDLDSVQACAEKLENDTCSFRLPSVDDHYTFPIVLPGALQTGKCFNRGVTLFCRASPEASSIAACNGKVSEAECVFEAPGSDTWVDVEAFTKATRFADTKGSVFVSFDIHGEWTSPRFFFRGTSKGEAKRRVFLVHGWPEKMALTINSNDAWGFWKITVNGSAILEDPSGMNGGTRYCSHHAPLYTGECNEFRSTPYWIEGPPASQFFDISDFGTGDAECSQLEASCAVGITVAAFTSTSKRADTTGCVHLMFLVHGKWEGPEGGYEFFCGAELGGISRKSYTLEEWPTKLWVGINSTDAWGFWKITVNGLTVIEDPAGQWGSHEFDAMSSEHAATTYWLESPARTQTIAIERRQSGSPGSSAFHVQGQCDTSWDGSFFCNEGAYIDRSPAETRDMHSPLLETGTYYVYVIVAVRNADFAQLRAHPEAADEFESTTILAIAERLTEDIGQKASSLNFKVKLSEGSVIITAFVALNESIRKLGITPKSVMAALRSLGPPLVENLQSNAHLNLVQKDGPLDAAVVDMGHIHEADTRNSLELRNAVPVKSTNKGCPGRGGLPATQHRGQICSRDYGDGHYEKACWLDKEFGRNFECSELQCAEKCRHVPWCNAFSFGHTSIEEDPSTSARECYLFENCRVLDDHDTYTTVSCDSSRQRQHMKLNDGMKAEMYSDGEDDVPAFELGGSHAGLVVGIVATVMVCLLCIVAVLVAYICRLRRQILAERKATAGWTTITVGRPVNDAAASGDFAGVAPGMPASPTTAWTNLKT